MLLSRPRCPSSSLMVLFPLIILQPLSLPLDCNETGSTQIHAFTVQILPMHRPEISSFLNLERGRRPLKHTLCTISPSDFPMVPISTLDTQIKWRQINCHSVILCLKFFSCCVTSTLHCLGTIFSSIKTVRWEDFAFIKHKMINNLTITKSTLCD